jgi:hypothetical protein
VVGVPLLAVLRRLGWEAGPQGKSVSPREKHSGYRFVIVASAAADSGPLRLVVPTDSSLSRSTFKLRYLDLLDVRKLVPNSSH